MKKFALPKFGWVMLLCMIFSIPAFSQTNSITVSGKIFNKNGEPLPRATVAVKGTGTRTLTKEDGTFELIAPSASSVLVISYVGFESQEVAIGTQREFALTLSPIATDLQDVVVIGYGTQKKKSVTGAVSSFDARKLEERPLQRVDQALVGQLAGVTVKQTNAIPGKAFSVQVRGSGSISGGNEPLYVIDGFPLSVNATNTTNGSFTTGNPLDNINPNDIESIEVLKDAAAAAIYGSRASNGVVLITTKRGRAGKIKIEVNTYTGYSEASKQLKMLNGEEWIDRATEIINATYVNDYKTAGATAADNDATRRAKIGIGPTAISTKYMLDPRWALPGHPGLTYHNWQDEIERKGLMQNYQVAASGGSESVRYFISGNYSNQDAFIRFVNYKSYSLRANVEVNASKKLKFGLNVAPSYTITQDPGVEGKDNIFHQALSMSPLQEDSVGMYPNIGKNAPYVWGNTTNGSLGKLTYNIGTTKRYRTLGSVFGDYEIIKGLNFRSSVNLDNTDNVTTGYFPYIAAGQTLASRVFNGTNVLTANTSGSYNSYRRQTFVNENTITYNTVIKDVHSLNLLAGFAYNLDRFDRTTLNSSGGYTSAVIQTLNAAVAVTGNTTSTRNVLTSYFSRLQYGFRDKYFLTASLRRDGSSRFGINNQYGTFPSASLKWVVSDEEFMKAVPVISDLKLRGSWGINGNNNLPNDYASLATIGSSGYVLGGTQGAVIGQVPNVLANPDLQWEKSETYDIGVDFGLFKNRLTGSFDLYNKLNTQLLLNVQVPEVTGFQTYLTNIGAVRNIGQELELTSRNMVGEFQWNTTVTLTHNTNKVLALGKGQKQIIIPNGLDVSDQILRVGSPLNSIYILKIVGFLSQKDITDNVARYGNEAVGDPKFEDYNTDGIISEADKQIMGHPNPDYTYGITNTFRYKGFDLTVLVQGQSGGSIYSMLGRAISRAGQGFTDNTPATFANRWKSPTDQGDGRFGKAYATFNAPITAASDWLYSSDYIRVRNITLGYDLKSLIKTRSVQGARVYVTLENFFGHDKYTNGLNPESANTAISSVTAYPEAGDYGGLPLPKSLIFGLNITF